MVAFYCKKKIILLLIFSLGDQRLSAWIYSAMEKKNGYAVHEFISLGRYED